MENYGFKYFNSDIVNKVVAYSESSKDKEEGKALVRELKEEYKKLDSKLLADINNELKSLKELHQSKIKEAKETKEKELSSVDTNQDKSELKNIVVGIKTVCKRSIKKENREYVEAIRLSKSKRVDLHLELVKLIANVTDKVSPLDSVRSKRLENWSTFNFKQTITSKRFWVNLIPLFMLILIIIAYAIGKNITGYNGDLGDVINNGIFVAVVATGAVFIYSQGGFDMSLGNASLMCATIAAITYNSTHNMALSLILAVLLGAGLGIINAILATMLNLPVMVMTLTMMNILSAVHEAILDKFGGLINVSEGMISSPWIYAIFLLVFFILCFVIFNYTKVGRRNKFIGANKVAAKFNGINLMRAGIISFAISGIGLGICGFIFACSMSGTKYGATTVLSQVGLNVVIAIVFGGMTTSGGAKSKVSCAIIGAFFSVFLDEFFAAISTPTFQVGSYSYMVKGIVFIIVSLANMWDTRSKMLASGGSIQ